MAKGSDIFGYSEEAVRAAFDLVKPTGNWKLAIDATVPDDADTGATSAAVAYYTGGEALFWKPENGTIRVTAPGYYTCVGS